MNTKIKVSLCIVILVILTILVMSTDEQVVVDSCVTCTVASINADDAAFETLDKNEVWTMQYVDITCTGDINGNVTVHMWDDGATETVTLDCSVDGSTWDKCGTNVWSPASSETPYTFAFTSSVTCANINSLQVRLASNDAGGPDDFYLDFTHIDANYTAPLGDTCDCSSIQTGTTVDCTENCDIDACDANGQNIIFSGNGNVVVNGDVTNIGTEVLIYNSCSVTCNGGCFII